MLRQVTIFALTLLSFGIATSLAQVTCVPNPVGEIDYIAGILTWAASENCPNTEYRVIVSSSDSVMYEFLVSSRNLSLAFLPMCRDYKFSISPVASNVLGQENYLEHYLAITNETDIVVEFLRAVLLDESDVLIDWQVDARHVACVTFFHLVINDLDMDTSVSQRVVLPGYLLQNAARCSRYSLQVRCYYLSEPHTAQLINYTVPAATNKPTLVEVRQDSSTINTTWSLQNYRENRCPVTNLYVNGTRFNATYPIEDVPERPQIQVSINGLRADSMYYFNVSTENNAGVSQAVPLGVQTSPVNPSIY